MSFDPDAGLERGAGTVAREQPQPPGTPQRPSAAEAAAARLARPAGAQGGVRLLVSVRDVKEALAAAAAGADLIDVKEPDAGALGAVPLHVVHEVVQALRAAGHAQPVSATVGDFPAGAAREPVLERVRATAACGVDLVKVGVARGDGATALLAALAGSPAAVVPVFFADEGLDEALLALACWLRFPVLMLDTADKRAGSLPDVLDGATLRHFIDRVRGAGKLAGVAGSLRATQAALVRELAPDIAGFRGAVCAAGRGSALEVDRVSALAAAFR